MSTSNVPEDKQKTKKKKMEKENERENEEKKQERTSPGSNWVLFKLDEREVFNRQNIINARFEA